MKKQTSIAVVTPLIENMYGAFNGGFSDIMSSIHLNAGELEKEKNICPVSNNCGKGLNCGKCGYANQ